MEKETSSQPNLSRKTQTKFEGGAYFVLNFMSIINAIAAIEHLGVFNFIATIMSFIAIGVILGSAFFLPSLRNSLRYSYALLIFICIITCATAIAGLILAF